VKEGVNVGEWVGVTLAVSDDEKVAERDVAGESVEDPDSVALTLYDDDTVSEVEAVNLADDVAVSERGLERDADSEFV
jgi:hypothetical protein